MRSYFLVLILFFCCFSSAGAEIPELKIDELENNVFLHKSYSQVDGYGLVSSNGLVVVSNNKAFIVDTPWSVQDTERLVNWIRSNNYELLGSVSTHSHDDRSAGIKWLNEHSIPTYATNLTNEILKNENMEPAKYSLRGNEAVLADGLLEVFYPGRGHTIDNVVVWLPKSKILFGGCFVRSLESQGLGYTGEAHIDQWAGSAKKVLSRFYEARVVIPGHGKVGDVELLRHTITLAESALTSPST